MVTSELCDGVATGSGFFISPNRVVTNHHVVEDATSVDVEANGKQIPVRKVFVSGDADLAILDLGQPVGTPLALRADPRPGDRTWAIGYPRGHAAVVSSGRMVDFSTDRTDRPGQRVIRSRATVDLGNSGGPLEDADGDVVGLVFAIDLRDGWTLAIPASRVARALDSVSQLAPATC